MLVKNMFLCVLADSHGGNERRPHCPRVKSRSEVTKLAMVSGLLYVKRIVTARNKV